MSRIIAVLSRIAAAHRRIIAVMSRIYWDYFGARHLTGDGYIAIYIPHNGFRRFSDCSTAISFNRICPDILFTALPKILRQIK